jgi:hypothetical protein
MHGIIPLHSLLCSDLALRVQETRPAAKRGTVLTEAELELEVKRLLGKNEGKL